jgi:acylphosphatase
MEAKLLTRRGIYRGQVQGVGFRRRTERIARSYPVAGYVRNLDDGSVELEVEGEPEAVERFLAAVAEELGRGIETVEFSDLPARGFRGFEIKRS